MSVGNEIRPLVPVILVGGSGSRLWPMSRTSYPKQFLSFGESESLFQKTILRLQSFDAYQPPLIVTNDDYRFLVGEQLRQIGVTPRAVLLEPVARNTAPAIAAAAAFVTEQDPDAILHVLPSDHHMNIDATYWDCVRRAINLAETGHLVTFGITPTEPATGYGYIEAGAALGDDGFAINRFVEKPDMATAQEMVAAGKFAWNSGMFVFQAAAYLSEARRLVPEVVDAATRATQNARDDLEFCRLDADDFATAPSISVDYAVFEKTDKAAVVPCDIKWSDLGTWASIWNHKSDGEDGSVVEGPATLEESQNLFVYSDGPHVAAHGVEDLIVVATDDAVLVTHKDRSEDMKTLVERLKASPDTSDLVANHRTDYRPWGGFTSLITGDQFQVKRLFVNPGRQLSLQMHHHRAEHWVVVCGTAQVTIDDTVVTVQENESVFIPLGAKHRLANPGPETLEVIEIQTGSYLGEDDIIRFTDDFGRK